MNPETMEMDVVAAAVLKGRRMQSCSKCAVVYWQIQRVGRSIGGGLNKD